MLITDSSTPDGVQSTLAPHGAEAARIAEITAVLLGGGALILLGVLALVTLALWRPRAWLASARLVVGAGLVFPLVTLTALLVYSWLATPDRGPGATPDVVVDVTGHQWWWRLRYHDARGGTDFETANELHVPVGSVVELRLASADVLHSFWVPALGGKLDLIPGRSNRLRVLAQAPGRLRGQCAEFCGVAHAWMGLVVVAEEPADYARWLAAQRAPAAAAAQPRGAALFAARCAVCHRVRGTAAQGTLGPDLTHVGTRATLGAGRLPNRHDTLARWLVDGQRLKPGNLMPAFDDLDADEVAALADYLAALR